MSYHKLRPCRLSNVPNDSPGGIEDMNQTIQTTVTGESVAFNGVFDLSSAEGVNQSERLLIRLCRKSFLSLWAHANLHTAQDMQGGKGSAKEFADVLVVFGDDVIIFSDKHIEFQQARDLDVAWPRWFNRAVIESAKQLHGAMNWLRRFPARIFLDASCTRPLPVSLQVERMSYFKASRGPFS